MADGTELPADLVVYATGYGSMNGWVADLISQDVADKVGKVWGLGSDTTKDPGPWEGEQRNMWKPTRRRRCGSTGATSPSRATTPCTSRCSSRRAWRGSTRRSTGCRRCTTCAQGPRVVYPPMTCRATPWGNMFTPRVREPPSVTDPDHLWSGNWRDRRREPAERPTVARLPERPPTRSRPPSTSASPPAPPRSRSPLLPALAGGAVSAVIVSAVLLGSGLVDGDDSDNAIDRRRPAARRRLGRGGVAARQRHRRRHLRGGEPRRRLRPVQRRHGNRLRRRQRRHDRHQLARRRRTTTRCACASATAAAPCAPRSSGSDPSVDIAVLHVDPAGAGKLYPLALADSDQVKVGDTAIAIGNPLGLDRTATSGIVSGLGREIRAPNGFQIDKVIQTDAPINPGNSGGPLLDSRGRVIGVNSQIATSGAGSGNIGIGFAVPSNTVRNVVPQLKTGQGVQHAYLGVSTAPRSVGGAEVGNVNPARRRSAPASEMGDIVTEVDGQEVGKPHGHLDRDRRQQAGRPRSR